MQRRSHLCFSAIPPIPDHSKGRGLPFLHEVGFQCVDAPLVTKNVFEGVCLESRACFPSQLPIHKVLQLFAGRRFGKWLASNCSQHLRGAIVVRHGRHGLHDPVFSIVRYSKDIPLLSVPPPCAFRDVCWHAGAIKLGDRISIMLPAITALPFLLVLEG